MCSPDPLIEDAGTAVRLEVRPPDAIVLPSAPCELQPPDGSEVERTDFAACP